MRQFVRNRKSAVKNFTKSGLVGSNERKRLGVQRANHLSKEKEKRKKKKENIRITSSLLDDVVHESSA